MKLITELYLQLSLCFMSKLLYIFTAWCLDIGISGIKLLAFSLSYLKTLFQLCALLYF
jgi:hypothetical protein